MRDRLEHYCCLKTISLDNAALLAVGILPEKPDDLIPIWWIDGTPLMTSDSSGWQGDDSDAIFQWVCLHNALPNNNYEQR